MIFIILFFIFGTIIGSFINCLVWRLKNNKNFVIERSQCPKCEKKLAWYENIPIFSFLVLRGKCRTCKEKIPSYYFWMEFFTGILFMFVWWFNTKNNFFNLYQFVFELVIVSILIFIFLYDALYKEISSKLIWFTVLIILIYYYFTLNLNYLSILGGAMLGFGFFALQYFVSKGRWIGGGDVRYGLLMGVLLGFGKTVIALLFSYWTGAIFGVCLMIFKKEKINSEIPFGTFLTVGTLFAFYFGEWILRWYGSFIN